MMYVLIMITDNQKSQAPRYRYGPVVKILVEKFRDFLEKNKMLKTNMGISFKNNVSSKTYLNVFKLISFYEFEIDDNIKYFIDIVTNKNFFSPEIDPSFKLEGYMSFYRYLYWYQDEQTKRNPILDRIE